ncbi:hypothetical protein [Streptomyces chiangmaiensis]|uniref:DUF4253 domain-containing protein n=1 Tax=Streptomyces chiangmaiensis TaxID=766497 RepID=A0ABU7FC95_9ACTN|nr:hypothetical protein [Streptomyces chiangmaiensis]MED7821787.1 hypothetical protein [Streptomyces chiangmaiensis]
MGVLTDYFRAGDAASVVQALERTGGGTLVDVQHPVFDGIEAKRVDPVVTLGMLIAAIKKVPWDVDLVNETTIWPTTQSPGPDGPADENDPWVTGPWVSELGTVVRDTLAGVHDGELASVVGRWVQAEELRPACVEDMTPLAEELVQLARRAREADEQLYCWSSL